jgi:hypothetical protein
MRLSALLLVLALGAALPLAGCDSSGIDGPAPGPYCPTGCPPTHPPVDPPTDPPVDPPTDPPGGVKTFVGLDGRDTFLRTNLDPDALGPAFLPIADLGLSEGDVACFQASGDYSLGGGVLASSTGDPLVIGAFSASDRFSGPESLLRIEDAVGPEFGLVTPVTAIGDLTTDFPQDFDATTGCVTVPDGAAFLFLGAWDAYYSDNGAAGSEAFGVRIQRD